MILDWSYNYHANDIYQQAAQIQICKKEKRNQNKNLICSQQTTVYTFVSVSIVIISFTWKTHRNTDSLTLTGTQIRSYANPFIYPKCRMLLRWYSKDIV